MASDGVANDIHVDAQKVPALRFKQWLAEWDKFSSVNDGKWKKPKPHIYLFSMRAGDLRNLSDVYRRKYEGDISEGVQRAQDTNRTGRIQRYVRYGYPFGDLPAPMRNKEHAHLRKPGWLPTAIVINILERDEKRRGLMLKKEHHVEVSSNGDVATIVIPEINADSVDYLAPFEVIDGQHRLWAFGTDGGAEIPDDFSLPVVAFEGLDIAWQAYLFWSINVSPKRINKSHAFDLYPLLRTQEWLEQFGELNVYREARAQELTSLMYSHEQSAWHHRINMLGEKGVAGVSQNAWVKALMSSFLATGKGTGAKGLFQAAISDDAPLPWSRGQQGAFLLRFWKLVQTEITDGAKHWWIREYKGDRLRAFTDRTSLLNQDMGLRAVLSLANDIFVQRADEWGLYDWQVPPIEDAPFEAEASQALALIDKSQFSDKLRELATGIVAFDWRSLDGPGVKNSEDEVLKRSFRGSGGYTALKIEVLKTIADEPSSISAVAADLIPTEG
jgi:hypothetical protein